jgi:hypothetical protein
MLEKVYSETPSGVKERWGCSSLFNSRVTGTKSGKFGIIIII